MSGLAVALLVLGGALAYIAVGVAVCAVVDWVVGEPFLLVPDEEEFETVAAVVFWPLVALVAGVVGIGKIILFLIRAMRRAGGTRLRR